MIGSATEIERNVLKGRDRRYRTAAMVAIASGRRSAKLRSGWMSRSTWSPATKAKAQIARAWSAFPIAGWKTAASRSTPNTRSGTPSATRSVKTATSPRVDARTTRNSGLLFSIAKTGWLTPYAHSETRCANRQRYAGSTMLAGRAGADAVAADVALTWRPPPRPWASTAPRGARPAAGRGGSRSRPGGRGEWRRRRPESRTRRRSSPRHGTHLRGRAR